MIAEHTVAVQCPPSRPAAAERLILRPFEPPHAERVASWVGGAEEMFWLAPGTSAPLTGAKVNSWHNGGGERFLLWPQSPGPAAPIGYGELNRMDPAARRLWIGHLILDPAHRRRGAGTHFVSLLLRRAFGRELVEEVLLVVLPDNLQAIRCYQRAGFVEAGRERKYFKTTGRRHEFIRMAIHRSRHEQLRNSRMLPLDCHDGRSHDV